MAVGNGSRRRRAVLVPRPFLVPVLVLVLRTPVLVPLVVAVVVPWLPPLVWQRSRWVAVWQQTIHLCVGV